MKKIQYVVAKRNRTPFLTDERKYELLKTNDSNTKYLIKNDAGTINWQEKSDFYHSIGEETYGLESHGMIIPGFITPVFIFVYDKDDKSFDIGAGILCFGFGFTFTKKPKF